MKLRTQLAGVAGLMLLLTGAALADPTYSIYSDPVVSDGGSLWYGLNDSGSYVGWSYSGGTYFGLMSGPDGKMTAIAPPSAIDTHPTGINDSNVIVGYYSDGTGGTHGFVKAGGSYSTLNAPGAVKTYAYGVNNKGQVVGYYVDKNGTTHGYIEYAGSFTTVDVPRAVATYGLSINQDGEIVGSYFDGTAVHGFIYHDGTIEYVDYPNAAVTWLTGINQDGTLVGWSRLCDTCVADAFVRDADGFTSPFQPGFPGYQYTGIDDLGLRAGSLGEAPTSTRGEIPEPGTAATLLGAGSLMLVLARCFRKKL